MWDIPPLTSALLGLSTVAVLVRFVCSKYPDIHPFALYHQASTSPVRNADESVVHRSIITPFTYPLVSGLNLREGHSFRDGDLRDVWDLGQNGKIGVFDKTTGQVDYFDYQSVLTQQIHVVANRFNLYLPGVKRIGIYLPNSIENVITTFACAHYDIATVLLPLTDDTEKLAAYLTATSPEILICVAGAIDFSKLKLPSSVKSVVLVDTGSTALNWTQQLNESLGTSVSAVTWNDVVSSSSATSSEGESIAERKYAGTAIVVPYTNSNGRIETAEFSHGNIVAAIAAQLRVLPHNETWKRSDVVVPIEPLNSLYSRVLFFSALTAGATVVFCGTTGEGFDMDAVKAVNPSILVTSPNSLRALTAYTPNLITRLRLRRAQGILASGNIPHAVLGGLPNLRIVYTHEDQPPTLASSKPASADRSFTSSDLSLVRALLGTHVIYALTHAAVAGSICQTNYFDYRDLGRVRVFGPVMPSLEAVVKDVEHLKARDRRGHLFVRGPAAPSRGWLCTDIVGEWGDDGCFREL